MKKQDKFKEMEEKAITSGKNYDYIILSAEKKACGAILLDSGASRIRNALIVVAEQGVRKVWKVKDFEMQMCPLEFSMCVKNMAKIWMCIGDREQETSYHFTRDIDENCENDLCVVGAVEAGGYIYLFSFDWRKGLNCCTLTQCESSKQTDLFVIMTNMYENGGEMSGAGQNTKQENIEPVEAIFG